MGLLRENMAAAHIHTLGKQTGVRLYHWREGNYEVDLVYNHPTHPLAFEIASSSKHSRRGLLKFIERHRRFAGGCYIVSPEPLMVKPESSGDGIGLIPLDLLLIAAGRQSEKACLGRDLRYNVGASAIFPLNDCKPKNSALQTDYRLMHTV